MTEKFEFKAGDIVSFVGCRGIVSEASPNRLSVDLYQIRVDLDNSRIEYFTLDGRHQHWHKEPLLKLIERPKKKVKKTVWVGISEKTNGSFHSTSNAYYSSEAAMNYGGFPIYPIEIEVEE